MPRILPLLNHPHAHYAAEYRATSCRARCVHRRRTVSRSSVNFAFLTGEHFAFDEEFISQFLPLLFHRRGRRDVGRIINPVELVDCHHRELPLLTMLMKQLFTYLYHIRECGAAGHDLFDGWDELFYAEHAMPLSLGDRRDSFRLLCHILSWDRGLGHSSLLYRSLWNYLLVNAHSFTQTEDLDMIFDLLQSISRTGPMDMDIDMVKYYRERLREDEMEALHGMALRYGRLGDVPSCKLREGFGFMDLEVLRRRVGVGMGMEMEMGMGLGMGGGRLPRRRYPLGLGDL